MSDDPLSFEQKAALQDARVAYQKVTRPARVASFNGWTIGVFGALSVLVGFGAASRGLLMGLVLIGLAAIELRGGRRVRLLDPGGATMLGWNQVALALLISLYCVVTILQSRSAPDPTVVDMEELAGVSASVVSELTTLLYASVAVIVCVIQGLLARYHFRSRRRIEAFRSAQPSWLIELL